MIEEMKQKIKGRRVEEPEPVRALEVPRPRSSLIDLLSALESYGLSPEFPGLIKRPPGRWVASVPSGGQLVSMKAGAAAGTILRALEVIELDREHSVFLDQKRSAGQHACGAARAWTADKVVRACEILRREIS